MHPPAVTFVERKRADGVSDREALWCLKRQIGPVSCKTMVRSERRRAGQVTQVEFAGAEVAVAV